jgi:hypothetical protein
MRRMPEFSLLRKTPDLAPPLVNAQDKGYRLEKLSGLIGKKLTFFLVKVTIRLKIFTFTNQT